MSVASVTSILVVRRSILIHASSDRVWEEFTSFERMASWWGAMIGSPEAGTANGQWLVRYEPGRGGHIEMEVSIDGAPTKYGGRIVTFERGRELTFESDWIPNQGWLQPTFITIRLTDALGGTLVELMHHGFEHTGGDVAEEHAGYEGGWGMTQLAALKRVAETS